ncbi:MAG: molybdate ABC transporter substrate-binding protein [Rothia sp. (in: high G+C Gram-positive bacteria)]|nr:molybdate ABC transporter substrate-binding protein [Rothia sp. (in: high G+C Gram-positive bacteria)]
MKLTPIAKISLVAMTILSTLGLAACSFNSSDQAQSNASNTVFDQKSSVQVFAAASLNSAGAELEKAFEESHPNTDISFNYAGSSKLVQQIQQGATPDILVTADQSTMDGAVKNVDDLHDAKPTVVATNQLVLASAADNPAHLNSVKDLKSSDATVALCAAEVPCGNLAHQELSDQNIELTNVTEEKNVSDVATKVSSGAVDAGFIYSTDAARIKKEQNITVIDLPDLEKNVYPMALTSAGEKNSAAEEFAKWLSGDEAQNILKKYDFGSAK